jgi:hypothetical protein
VPEELLMVIGVQGVTVPLFNKAFLTVSVVPAVTVRLPANTNVSVTKRPLIVLVVAFIVILSV